MTKKQKNLTLRLPLDIDRVVVGYSGGPDSSVLLDCLVKTLGKDNVKAVHVNHMLRGKDSDSDEEFCKKTCADYGCDFYSEKVDIQKLSKGKAVEETARNERYKILEKYADKLNIRYIALAHTSSDNLETVLFNCLRGSGINGVRGIPYSRPLGSHEIIRPLIKLSRQEIEEYIKDNNLGFVTDKTNSDTHYTRNFIRGEIVPLLKKVNSGAESNVSSLSDMASDDVDYIEGQAKEYYAKFVTDSGYPVDKLISVHKSISSRIIVLMYGSPLEKKHVDSVLDMLNSGKENAPVILPGKTAATVENGYFRIVPEKEILEDKRPEYSYPVSNREYSEGFFISDKEDNRPGFSLVGYAFFTKEDLDKMVVRSWTTKDSYRFWKMTRNIKKVSSSLPDCKRKIRPVFDISGEVVWYPGYPQRDNPDEQGEYTKIYYYEKEAD